MSAIQQFNLIITDKDEQPVFNGLDRNNDINENESNVFEQPLVEHADQGQSLRFELLRQGITMFLNSIPPKQGHFVLSLHLTMRCH